MRDIAMLLYYFFRARRLMGRFQTRAQLLAWQHARLGKFIAEILPKSPFYRAYGKQALNAFPYMTKSSMMAHFDNINTVGISRENAFDVALQAEQSRDFTPMIGDITVGLSSGTSGNRGIFLASANERLLWAGIMLAKALPGNLFKKYKIAFFLRANSNLYTTLTRNRRIQFTFFDLTQPFNKHLSALQHYQPHIIVAPSGILKYIAQAQDNADITISPQKIFAAAEVLDPADKVYIEKIFKQAVQHIYQCTEGFLGISDAQGRLYLNEEYLYIEKDWVDQASGRFVPIITDFSRVTQPIVRYRLDDILIEDRNVSSPFTYLKSVEGRCDDTFYFANNSGGLMPIFADSLRQMVTGCAVACHEYKFTQSAIDRVDIALQPFPDAETQAQWQNLFIHLAHQHGFIPPTLFFIPYQSPLPAMKLRRIERRFTLEADV